MKLNQVKMSFEFVCVCVCLIIIMMYRNTSEVLRHGGVCNELHFAIMLSLTHSSITNLIHRRCCCCCWQRQTLSSSSANKQKWKKRKRERKLKFNGKHKHHQMGMRFPLSLSTYSRHSATTGGNLIN